MQLNCIRTFFSNKVCVVAFCSVNLNKWQCLRRVPALFEKWLSLRYSGQSSQYVSEWTKDALRERQEGGQHGA